MSERSLKIALFAGSFDPFTRGHAAVVESALRIADRVVIGVGHNINKGGLLSLEGRCELIKEVYKSDERVEVLSYEGMTGEFAREVGATILVRGVRTMADLEFERTVESVNRSLYPELQSVLLLPPAELQHFSSSVVRELLNFGQCVDEMMPKGVSIDKFLK